MELPRLRAVELASGPCPFDTAGDLVFADVGASGDTQSLIRVVANPIASGGCLTTIAGQSGFNGFVNTPPYSENNALDVFVDSSNNIYIADTGNCIVRSWAPAS